MRRFDLTGRLLLSAAVVALVTGATVLLALWLTAVLTFRDEDVLYLLGLVPLLTGAALAGWTLRQRATRRFGDVQTTRALVVGRSGALRATRGVVALVGLALLVIAVAGPRYGSRTRILHQRGVDVVIALDFSKSMLARDVRPNRIERAKAEIMRFAEELGGDRVGVVAFAGETIEFPMTSDYAALGLFLRELGPYDMPVGGTAIGRALISAKRLLDRSGAQADGGEEAQARERSRVVILFTDGEDHEGDPVEAARELAEAGIKVYVVGIGSRTPEPIPTYAPDGTWTGYLHDDEGNLVNTALTADNETTLEAIAEATGGRYFRAARGDVGVRQIRREMRRMKQQEQRSRRVTVHEERYALVLLPAFLLLVLEGLLPDAWIGRRRRRREAAKAAKGGA